jgi:ferrous iron transport protein A
MEEKCTLDMLSLNKSGVICAVNCQENLKNRLYDFGVLNNSVITPIYRSPFGDPTAYLIKNAVVALRKKDCANITVCPI